MLGSMLSILTLCVVIVYGGFKTSDLFNKRDYKIRQNNLHDYFDESESFGPKDGFMIAAGLISFDGNYHFVEEDESYGRLQFLQRYYDG